MSSGAIIVIAVIAVVVLGVIFLAATGLARRDRAVATGVLSRETLKRDRSMEAVEETLPATVAPATGREVERAAALARTIGPSSGELVVAAPPSPPVPFTPPDPETYAVTRRKFLNRSITGLMVVSLSGFGAAVLAFLWPTLESGGFGSKINAGPLTDITTKLQQTLAPVYYPQGRFYINPYPTQDIDKAKKVYTGAVLTGMESGVVALYQKCVHLGCRVPWCQTSQWFECPCHGSKYNRVGEKKGGPAPRGLDRFGVSVSNGNVIVDTGTVVLGPPIGTNTTGQGQEGPHCT
jgi:cytochrome b6-f complex iron-sulfur subunit